MGIFQNWFGIKGVEVHNMDEYDIKSIGNLVIPEKLTNKNAFILANSVAEIYFPIDFYADRISKLRFFIADKKGEEITTTELNRFVSDKINPLFTFSDLIYNYVFSLLADGNSINYLSVPSLYQTKPTPANISRWDVLQPNLTTLSEYNNISILNVSKWNELIKKAQYSSGGFKHTELNVEGIFIDNYGSMRRSDSNVLSLSPLFAANKSIDTLLSVYSARYNVYANNGAAGYLSKKTSSGKGSNLESVILDSGSRDDMVEEINNRNGITGRKNIWGVSSVPLEFTKTLATIRELMPFEETLEGSIKIASVFQIPPVLVPRKDQSTYDNQSTAEQNVWENGLLSMAKTVCQNLTNMFGIGKYDVHIDFDTTNVSALVQNESDKEELTKKKLDNISLIKSIDPNYNVKAAIDPIIEDYGKKEN